MFLLFIEHIACAFKKPRKMSHLSNLLILVSYVVLTRGMSGWLLNTTTSTSSSIATTTTSTSESRISTKIPEVLL